MEAPCPLRPSVYGGLPVDGSPLLNRQGLLLMEVFSQWRPCLNGGPLCIEGFSSWRLPVDGNLLLWYCFFSLFVPIYSNCNQKFTAPNGREPRPGSRADVASDVPATKPEPRHARIQKRFVFWSAQARTTYPVPLFSGHLCLIRFRLILVNIVQLVIF